MNKHVVEVIGKAASEGVSQFSKQELLLRHSHQLLVAYGRKMTAVVTTPKRKYFLKICFLSFPKFASFEEHVKTNLVGGPRSCTAGELQRH